MNLRADFQQITAQLNEALREQARINARIAGLQAERDALAQALATTSDGRDGDRLDLSRMSKTDAILAVLRSAGSPLTIPEIVTALHDAGRPRETYNGVSVYLQGLLAEERVDRPSRGHYVAT